MWLLVSQPIILDTEDAPQGLPLTAGVQASPDAPAVRISGTALLERNDFPRKSVGHISVFLAMSENINLFIILKVKCLSDLFSFLNPHNSEADEREFAIVVQRPQYKIKPEKCTQEEKCHRVAPEQYTFISFGELFRDNAVCYMYFIR